MDIAQMFEEQYNSLMVTYFRFGLKFDEAHEKTMKAITESFGDALKTDEDKEQETIQAELGRPGMDEQS